MPLWNKLPRPLVGAALLTYAATAVAQFDVQLPLQYGMQQMIGNPAALQDHKVSVALPSLAGGFSSPFSLEDLGELRDGTLLVDADQAIARLQPRGNDQRAALAVQTFAVNFRRGGWQLGLSHALRFDGTLDFPRGLAQLAAHGNARYVGETLQIAPAGDGQAYQEFGLNGALSVSDRVTVGGRVKYLAGIAAWQTNVADATLYTDPAYYASTLRTNVTYHSAGLPVSFGDSISVGAPQGLAGGGSGVGLDLGIVLRPTEDIEIGLAVRDVGVINWNGEARKHRSQGEFGFAGYEGDVFAESFEFDVAALTDSLARAVSFETTEENFSTVLPTVMQATVRYRLGGATSLDGSVYTARSGRWNSGFGVGVHQRVGQVLHLGALAGMKQGGGYLATNILIDAFGPQLYFACDNLLALTNLNGAEEAYFRAGLNLTFKQVRPGRAVKGWYDIKVEGINK